MWREGWREDVMNEKKKKKERKKGRKQNKNKRIKAMRNIGIARNADKDRSKVVSVIYTLRP